MYVEVTELQYTILMLIECYHCVFPLCFYRSFKCSQTVLISIISNCAIINSIHPDVHYINILQIVQRVVLVDFFSLLLYMPPLLQEEKNGEGVTL